MTPFEEHKVWWERRHAGEPYTYAVLGLFKALRNFVDPLLRSMERPEVGVDWNAEASKSIGDMLMYMYSAYHSLGQEPDPVYGMEYDDLLEAVANAAETFSQFLRNSGYSGHALAAVYSLAYCCGVMMVHPLEKLK